MRNGLGRGDHNRGGSFPRLNSMRAPFRASIIPYDRYSLREADRSGAELRDKQRGSQHGKILCEHGLLDLLKAGSVTFQKAEIV